MHKEFAKHEQEQYLNNATKDDWKRQLEFGISLMSQAIDAKQDVNGNSLTDIQINDCKSIIQRLQTQLNVLTGDKD
jgi:hypothetical protein